jgi:hypothetical protein
MQLLYNRLISGISSGVPHFGINANFIVKYY